MFGGTRDQWPVSWYPAERPLCQAMFRSESAVANICIAECADVSSFKVRCRGEWGFRIFISREKDTQRAQIQHLHAQWAVLFKVPVGEPASFEPLLLL